MKKINIYIIAGILGGILGGSLIYYYDKIFLFQYTIPIGLGIGLIGSIFEK